MDSGHIFLSYSTTDRPFADDLLRRLESKGVRVWMAPRDVRPGSDYSESIQDAIETSAAVVALVSGEANRSRHVRAEIEIAFSCGKPLFPVRFSDVTPAKGLALFLGLGHWTDLFGADEAANLDRLAAALNHPPSASGPAPPPPPPPRAPPAAPPPRKSKANKWMIAAICLSLAIILGVAVLAILRNAGYIGGRDRDEADESAYAAKGTSPAPIFSPEPDRNDVQANVAVPAVEPEPPPPAGGEWILGSWILTGESCSGREGATYGTDHNWATAGGGGTWSIEGNILTNITYYRVRQGSRVPRDPPMTARYEALSITPQEILLRFPDGSERSLYRCP
ncbi:MAG TPA: toll/interleukin-1 receptor domain-containing protein [Allosphingosinicella sp.]|nr:toll/interleukin-1 receptor domain-containing protein [Allosphingosinicella sp.]